MDCQGYFDSYDSVADNFGWANYFIQLRNTKTFVDVTIVLETEDGEGEFAAHQLVLAMRSPVFADMFFGDQRQKKRRVIRLGKVNPEAFDATIGYCYCITPAMETVDEISALFKVANQFKIMSLTNICCDSLKRMKIEPTNVFSMLEMSDSMENSKMKKWLRDRSYKYLQENTEHVIAAYNLCDITPAMVHTIMDLTKLSFSSAYELIRWVFEWGTARSEKHSARRNVREYLKTFLKDMNFLALTPKEFAILCKEYPNFFSAGEIASISLNIAFCGSRKMPDWYVPEQKLREYTRKDNKCS